MADRLEDFQKFRDDLNEEILGCGHLGMKRFFALDHQAYEPGPLGTKTKELLGLVASAKSMVCIPEWSSINEQYFQPAIAALCSLPLDACCTMLRSERSLLSC